MNFPTTFRIAYLITDIWPIEESELVKMEFHLILVWSKFGFVSVDYSIFSFISFGLVRIGKKFVAFRSEQDFVLLHFGLTKICYPLPYCVHPSSLIFGTL